MVSSSLWKIGRAASRCLAVRKICGFHALSPAPTVEDGSDSTTDVYAVVYLSAKLGQVTGKGLFHNLKDHYPRWRLWPTLIGDLIGNTVEAGADLSGMAAAINQFVPVPIWLLVVVGPFPLPSRISHLV
jgi:hypothetical protein